ncbi:hypothetical protein EKO27_g3190 [Xylaria grammica]|uniref:Uncharacterized protein n=1 Tax=Xylaria grammica TaxID=363999 RepID=A0A439DBY3_9PEZI|nr:hypothetical protein EKO27_g3190 [Xylaria grammica]
MDELQFLNPLSKEAEIKQLPGFPRLKPAYILKINLGQILSIGKHSQGEPGLCMCGVSYLCRQETSTGSLTTADGYEHAVTGEVVYGADWLINDPDEKHARPNLKLLIKTDDGIVLSSEYTGVAVFSEPINRMWQGDPSVKTFPFGISTTVHSFSTGEPKYKHLEQKTFVGNGRFVIGENPRTICVESRISEVIASCDGD